MRKIKDKKVIIPALVLGLMLGGAGVYSINKASANNGANQTEMVDKLSQKLNIDKTQVETALDQVQTENRAERQKEMETQRSADLDKAVTDGVITADQKQKLLDKQAEMQKKREQEKADMDQWMKDNGIDQTKLKTYMGGHGKGRGFKGEDKN